jgi:L-ascorbate metabolism protein UlaG (beta-lactamase superfamily)
MLGVESANRRWPGLLAVAFGLLEAGGCCDLAAPAYIGASSDHYDGRRFHNLGGAQAPGLMELLRWKWNDAPGPWEESSAARPGTPPPRRVGTGQLRVTFVNHSTLLLQLNDLNILTDPIWSERASPVSFAGPKRARQPGIRFEDLPPIDLVLVSHDHYDHLDLSTLERLASTFQPRFIVPLGNRDLLAENQIPRVEELDWWQSFQVAPGTRVWAVPAQHFSQRGVCDRCASLWAGFVIQSDTGYVYFAGDTAWGPHFEQIRTRFGAPRLALLPIGAFEPDWFMQSTHMNPEQALDAHRALSAQASVAMHFGTFRLGDDGQREAPERLLAAVAKAADPSLQFWVLDFGEGRDLPAQISDGGVPEPSAEGGAVEPSAEGGVPEPSGDGGVPEPSAERGASEPSADDGAPRSPAGESARGARSGRGRARRN